MTPPLFYWASEKPSKPARPFRHGRLNEGRARHHYPMSTDLPTYLRCKPLHPLEREAAVQVAAYLQQIEWPARHRVDIQFTFEVSNASKLDVVIADADPNEPAFAFRLSFNHWFLVSNPRDMFRYVIPAETAWTVAKRIALETKSDCKDYGPEWAAVYAQFTDASPYDVSQRLERFDARAMRLARGAMPVRCACPGDSGFSAYGGKRERLDAGEHVCARCKKGFRLIPMAEITAEMQAGVAYIKHAEARARTMRS